LRFGDHDAAMAYIELIPQRLPDGTIVLRGVVVGVVERLRRFLRSG
jgi:hypothetical protein